MSIGNLKDSGNQGNNFPFQRAVLNGLGGGPRSAKLSREIGPGIIGEKVYSFSVSNVGSADGVLLGSTLKAGETVNFDGNGNNYFPLGAISFDATGTEFLIIYVAAV